MWSGYENTLARYLEFCNYFSLNPFPLVERVSALFAQFLANNKLQGKTIRGKLWSRNSLCVLFGYPILEKQFFGELLVERH